VRLTLPSDLNSVATQDKQPQIKQDIFESSEDLCRFLREEEKKFEAKI
jgi:hypothetical protein